MLAGNNEAKDTDPDSWLKTKFPARYIYEKILPDVMAKYLPSVQYQPGRPFGGTSTTDGEIGNIHQWSVWHARWKSIKVLTS